MSKSKNDIGKLDGAPAVERVIDGETTKLFRCFSVVLSRESLDCFIDAHDLSEAALDLNGPVRVLGFDKTTIVGFASFRWQGDLLFSSVTLEYGCPERLFIQVHEEPVWLDLDFALSENEVFYISHAALVTKRPDQDDYELPLAEAGNP